GREACGEALQGIAKPGASDASEAAGMQLPHHITPAPAGRAGARLAVVLAAGAALLLGACGGDDGDAAPGSADTATAVEDAPPGTTPDPADAAGGIEPAEPCGLLDLAAVDGWLATSGV